MKSNPNYEAGFTRAVADELSPEEIARAAASRARRKKVLIGLAVVVIACAAAGGVLQLRRDTPDKQLARAKTYTAAGNHASALVELKHSLQGRPDQAEARFLLGNELWFYNDAKGAEIEYQKAIQLGLPAETGLVPLLRTQLAQGKFDQVVIAVNAALIESPEINAELQTMLGTAYIAQGKLEAGMSALGAAKDLVPHFSGALIAEARYLYSQQKFEEAATTLAGVPADDKRQGDLQVLKGDIAYALKKPDEAVVAYQAALKLNPGNEDVGIHLAQIHIDLGQYDLAQSRIDAVTKKDPRNARAQYIRALAAYLRHDLPKANDAIIQSVQLLPTDGRAQLLAGIVGIQLGQLVDAEPHLLEAIRLIPPGTEARKALVNLYMQRGEVAHASEALQPLMAAADPEAAALIVKLAVLQGDSVRASSLFEQATARQSTDVATSLVGSTLLLSIGKGDAAIARLNAASHAHPEDTELDAALVMAQLQLKHYDAALAAWQVFDRKKPDNARAYQLLSQIASARNDTAGARKALEKALALDPTYFPATASLVTIDLQAEQIDQARARLNRAIAADPRSVDAPLMLARLEESRGSPPATVVELLKAARTRDPKSMPAVMGSVAYYERSGDAAAELAAAREGLAIDPNNQQLLAIVGDLLQQTGPKERALPTLIKLATLNSENPDYVFRLGLSQLAAGQTEPALDSFRNAFKRAPQRTDLQMETVAALITAGKTEEAKRALFEASQQAPNSPVLGGLDADIKLATKQYPEALAAYKQALASTPSTRLAIKTYQAMMTAKQRTQANAVLADWQASHPTDAAMWLFDAQVGIDAKDFTRAANAFRRILDTRPDDPVVLNNLAWALDQVKDPKALAFAEKANQLVPNNADFADTYGGILVQQGQTGKGLEMFTKATSLAPKRVDIRLRMAKAQIKGERKDAARATLQTVINEAPDSAEGKESRSLLSTL